MKCNVIKDLMPLCIDGCCSEESALLVEEHMAHCTSCAKLYESMKFPCELSHTPAVPRIIGQLNSWKASVLQSILLFSSFAVITAGVALEAGTPIGPTNGHWAVSLIIPATGFLLSLANWYFVRIYQSRKQFSTCSLLSTLCFTLCAYLWSGYHYAADFTGDNLYKVLLPYSVGVLLTVLLCTLSKVLSNLYAKMIGKE